MKSNAISSFTLFFSLFYILGVVLAAKPDATGAATEGGDKAAEGKTTDPKKKTDNKDEGFFSKHKMAILIGVGAVVIIGGGAAVFMVMSNK